MISGRATQPASSVNGGRRTAGGRARRPPPPACRRPIHRARRRWARLARAGNRHAERLQPVGQPMRGRGAVDCGRQRQDHFGHITLGDRRSNGVTFRSSGRRRTAPTACRRARDTGRDAHGRVPVPRDRRRLPPRRSRSIALRVATAIRSPRGRRHGHGCWWCLRGARRHVGAHVVHCSCCIVPGEPVRCGASGSAAGHRSGGHLAAGGGAVLPQGSTQALALATQARAGLRGRAAQVSSGRFCAPEAGGRGPLRPGRTALPRRASQANKNFHWNRLPHEGLMGASAWVRLGAACSSTASLGRRISTLHLTLRAASNRSYPDGRPLADATFRCSSLPSPLSKSAL